MQTLLRVARGQFSLCVDACNKDTHFEKWKINQTLAIQMTGNGDSKSMRGRRAVKGKLNKRHQRARRRKPFIPRMQPAKQQTSVCSEGARAHFTPICIAFPSL